MYNRDEKRPSSLPTLMAWISVCLISAAWGPIMPEVIRHIWGYLGLFGLVAGIGLAVLERARLRKEEEQNKQDAINELARFDRIMTK